MARTHHTSDKTTHLSQIFHEGWQRRAAQAVASGRPTMQVRIRCEVFDHTTRRYLYLPGGVWTIALPVRSYLGRVIWMTLARTLSHVVAHALTMTGTPKEGA